MAKTKLNESLYNSTHDVNYIYSPISFADLGKKVLELRKQYPNNGELGDAIESFLLEHAGCPTFPGIQKL